MQKKLYVLTRSSPSLLTYFDPDEEINYELFKRGVIDIISGQKEKVKLSEDDVKTLFYLIDEETRGYLTADSIAERLENI